MDRLEFYRETIENVLKKHADIPYSYGEIDEYLIVDRDRNHFLLLDVVSATRGSPLYRLRDRLTQLNVQLAHILFFPQVP